MILGGKGIQLLLSGGWPDLVPEPDTDFGDSRGKMSIGECPVEFGICRKGILGSLVERDHAFVAVHRGAIVEPVDAPVVPVEEPRPGAGSESGCRVDRHGASTPGHPGCGEIQKRERLSQAEDDQPGVASSRVYGSRVLEHLCKRRGRVRGRIQDASLLRAERIKVMIEPASRGAVVAELFPSGRVWPSPEIDPAEKRSPAYGFDLGVNTRQRYRWVG